jgi:hypothetical protein
MMEGEAEAITRKAVDLALAGDAVAMRLVMERLVSPVRERPVNVAMPKIKRCDQDNAQLTPDRGGGGGRIRRSLDLRQLRSIRPLH